MAVKVTGSLPKSDRNGLAALETQLIQERHEGKSTIAVVVLGTTGAVESVKNDWKPEPVLSIIHVEPIDDEGRDTALALLRRGYESRTGRVTLNIDEEPEVQIQALTAEAGEYFIVSSRIPGDRTQSPIVLIKAYTAANHLIGERHVPTAMDLIQALGIPELSNGSKDVLFDSIGELPAFLGEVAALILADRGRDADEAIDAELVEDGASE